MRLFGRVPILLRRGLSPAARRPFRIRLVRVPCECVEVFLSSELADRDASLSTNVLRLFRDGLANDSLFVLLSEHGSSALD